MSKLFNDIKPKGLETQPDTIKKFSNNDMTETNYIKDLKMTNLIKPIAYLLLIILGALFTYIFPGSGIENVVIPAVASLAGFFGIKNWRENYGVIKLWFESKSVFGALIAIVPVIVLTLSYFIGFGLPGWLAGVLGTLVTIGGGGSIYGMIDAYKKANDPSL